MMKPIPSESELLRQIIEIGIDIVEQDEQQKAD
jgi:hypothetical protein